MRLSSRLQKKKKGVDIMDALDCHARRHTDIHISYNNPPAVLCSADNPTGIRAFVDVKRYLSMIHAYSDDLQVRQDEKNATLNRSASVTFVLNELLRFFFRWHPPRNSV
jgi:hypothetical protein